MDSPYKFKAPYYQSSLIYSKADEFRNKYWPSNQLPIDIMKIIEFNLNLEIIPIHSLKDNYDIDALLMGDFKSILVDYHQFMDDRYQNRLRFSLAHEIGHFVLHKEIFKKELFRNPEDWLTFFVSIPDKESSFLEFHANEFAGRLLVPYNELKIKVEEALKMIERENISSDNRFLPDYIAHFIHRDFEVSEEVILKRIQKEKLL